MTWGTFDPDEGLVFVPLGGVGEIGMNLYAYGCDGRWLAVDCGVAFRDDKAPGTEVVMADPQFLADRRASLDGLVLTHAHEDHIGAVAQLWPRLRCPVYGTAFTLAMLEGKLAEAGIEIPLTRIPLGGSFSCGPFDLRYVTLTHSIPEPSALVIATPYGTVVHSGDWKLDESPLVGEGFDRAALSALGDAGVLAVVGDSTNAPVPGRSGSEAGAREALVAAMASVRGRVVVGCFASNAARVESIAHAAGLAGRDVCLLGRSLHRVVEASAAAGRPLDLGRVVPEADAGSVPDGRICMIATGSQGEPRAALARIAQGTHPGVSLGAGDTVIFSSRVIPGNERAVLDVQNALVSLGVEILTARELPGIHVSGHPAQDELKSLYGWLRPRILIPVHGESLHLDAHARLGKSLGIPNVIVPFDGVVVRIAPGEAEKIGTVPVGRLAQDGTRLLSLESETLRNRRRIMYNGMAVVTLVIDGKGDLQLPPRIAAPGLLEEGDAAVASAVEAAIEAVRQVSETGRPREDLLQETVRRAVRRCLRVATGKRPVTLVQVMKV